MIPYIKTSNGVSAVVNGRSVNITEDHPSYKTVWEAITQNKSEAEVERLFDTATALKSFMHGEIEVKDGQVLYKNQPMHNVVTQRIIEFCAKGLPYKPLVRFLERLLRNPSWRAIRELFLFLQHEALPITEDGYVLGYKGVKDDYMDVYSGKYDNHPGKENSMPRCEVDDDFRKHCSSGFHIGSLKYALGFGKRVVIVKFDPADAVSVPEDENFQKLRVCKYNVVCDYKGALDKGLHNAEKPYAVTTSEPKSNRWGESWVA